MQIEEYISELLFEHDCVIVPDFGGFIGNYSASRIDPVKHLLEPPRKKILFNKGLIQNDGLLANHISKYESISYSAALSAISKAVKNYQAAIKKDKRVSLDNIGLLYTDEQGNLLFQQDEKINYLPEAFGLSAFYHLPHTNELGSEGGKVVELHTAQRNRLRPYAAAAVIGAVVASTFWISFNQDKLGINYSNLNLFAKKTARTYNSVPRESLPVSANTKDSTTAISFLHTSEASGNYHIIAGCFRYKGNAQSLIHRMQKRDVSASIIGTNPQGLYMVGCGKYTTREEAEQTLVDFRKNVEADAWVFQKPGKI